MALSNLDRVNKGLELLHKGLHPYVIKEMKESFKKSWEDEAIESFPDGHHARNAEPDQWDVQALLLIMWKQWQVVFGKQLGFSEKSIISELMDIRKRAAHQNKTNAFNTDDAYRVLDNVERLLTSIASPDAEEAEHQKSELLRIRYEESTRKKAKKLEANLIESQVASGLVSWRQVITPHPDVASGKYQQAEFAADLWRVYQDGKEAGEYGKPVEFFSRTYLTNGIRKLLLNGLRRLNGKGGDPVINLQTNFGGGKTHSLLALYHLFSGTNFSSIRDLEEFFGEAEGLKPSKVNKAILVGNRITPGIKHKKPDGTEVHTLWGEMAWQLGGKDAYKIVKDADEKGSNPGDQLVTLFRKHSPCLILIDEWVAYARQLHDSEGQLSGSYGTHISFAQALCEAAKTVDNALVVISLPASDIEMGGERGRQAAEELRNIVARIESPWSAATTEEAFEIVTRRLFTPISSKENFAKRDSIARAFGDFYRSNKQDFPPESISADYEKRIRDFFPIHPELFDCLADRWASIDKFQKTRGILRLMAKIIHWLWENNDQSPLILPAHVPVDDSGVQEEMFRYLDEPWRAVIHSDVDSPNSLPKQIDGDLPNLGRYSATRRVARTTFFGSAPTFNAATKGINELHIKLGSILPGETIPAFSDALRHLNDRATYLYYQNRNYWYSTQPTVRKIADERSHQIQDDRVQDEIHQRLTQLVSGSKGQISKIHLLPQTSSDVADDMDLKLVVLGLKDYHSPKDGASPAFTKAKDILNQRGSSQRLYKNTLLFLAPDKARLEELKNAVKAYLAWKSIQEDKIILNLDAFQISIVEGNAKSAKDTIQLRLPETFIWILTPYLENTSGDVQWDESKINGSAQEPLSSRVVKKLVTADLLKNDYASTLLKNELERIPLWRDDYVLVKQLKEDFAKYLYLPKLISVELLKYSIESGVNLLSWRKDTFGYADSFDKEQNRFKGLRAGSYISISLEGGGMLVKPEVCYAQLEIEKSEAESSSKGGGPNYPPADTPTDGAKEPDPKVAKKTRFSGDVEVDPIRFFRDAENIEKEILKHLSAVKGSKVKITVHIEATSQDGFNNDLERTVKENSRTLGFGSADFD